MYLPWMFLAVCMILLQPVLKYFVCCMSTTEPWPKLGSDTKLKHTTYQQKHSLVRENSQSDCGSESVLQHQFHLPQKSNQLSSTYLHANLCALLQSTTCRNISRTSQITNANLFCPQSQVCWIHRCQLCSVSGFAVQGVRHENDDPNQPPEHCGKWPSMSKPLTAFLSHFPGSTMNRTQQIMLQSMGGEKEENARTGWTVHFVT